LKDKEQLIMRTLKICSLLKLTHLYNNILMKRLKKGLLFFGVFAFGFLTTYLTLTFSKVFVKKPSASTSNAYADSTPAPVENSEGVFNVLFLGYGGAGHSGSYLTDSIIVIHVNSNSKKAALISIPRDLWMQSGHKINAEASINGFENAGGSVQSVTGLHIDYFVSVDFDGFSKIIDDLGGVTVEVPKAFDDPFYPITGEENNTCGKTEDEINDLKAQYSGYNLEIQFTCRYERLHFNKGPANLDGVNALKFVRSRHGDSDFARSARQFAVLEGIRNKLVSIQSSEKLEKTINTVSNIVRTDLTAGTIKTLIGVFASPDSYEISRIQLTTENVLVEGKSADGQYILRPKAGSTNYTELKSYIAENL